MELYQLKTFVTVAHVGSITLASKQLHLSQPAVSAHIKTLEEALGLTLFERTPKGMRLTQHGQQLKKKAEQVLEAHQAFIDEASRAKGLIAGKLRLGVGANSNMKVVQHLLSKLASRYPEVEISLEEGDTEKILDGLLKGTLDAGVHNETASAPAKLESLEISRFKLYLVAPPDYTVTSAPIDWQQLADAPWISPPSTSCCGQAIERFFQQHQFRPKQVIRVDRERSTRSLVASGIGVGVLHDYTAQEALSNGEVEFVCEVGDTIRTFFAYAKQRQEEPLLGKVLSMLQSFSSL
ncbi:MAG: LysR family transcriptional regulator [Myxococcales bacterium]|nr:LysR family transcriptional regulator [Myxococcales bacterium]